MSAPKVVQSHRQAIVTKYHGPTNFKGARITARCGAGRVTLGWDHSLNVAANHAKAAEALITKLGWDWGGTWVGGGSPDGTGDVFVYFGD